MFTFNLYDGYYGNILFDECVEFIRNSQTLPYVNYFVLCKQFISGISE